MKFVRIVLQYVGAIALIAMSLVAVYAFRQFSGPSKVIDKDDAIFVLSWAGVDKAQNWFLIDASVSARSMTGDHVDYYCIQLEDISMTQRNAAEWQLGPESNELLSSALEQAVSWAKQEGADCFPSFEIANSVQMKILFWSMSTHGQSPAGAQVLLLHPAMKRLFYVSFST